MPTRTIEVIRAEIEMHRRKANTLRVRADSEDAAADRLRLEAAAFLTMELPNINQKDSPCP